MIQLAVIEVCFQAKLAGSPTIFTPAYRKSGLLDAADVPLTLTIARTVLDQYDIAVLERALIDYFQKAFPSATIRTALPGDKEEGG